MTRPDLRIAPLEPSRFALVAGSLSDPMVNQWMYHEWREHSVTERTIAASVAGKRNRIWQVDHAGRPYGVVALGSISAGDRTAMLWYLRLAQAERMPGVMSDAVSTVVGEAFSPLDLNSVTASAHADNHASLRLLERVGFRRVGVLREGFVRDGRFVDRILFDRLRSDPPHPG